MKRGRDQMTRGPSTQTLMLNLRTSKCEDIPRCLEELRGALEGDRFPDLMISCALSFPDSMDNYAYMCGLINMEKKVDEIALKKKSVVERIMTRIETKLAEAFSFQAKTDYDIVRKLVKFLAHLMHARIVSSDDMLAVLQKLVVPLSYSNKTSKSYTNFLAYTTVATLPWCAEFIIEHTSDESVLESVMTPLREYLTQDRSWFDCFSPVCNSTKETEHIQCEDILFSYWKAMEQFKTASDWKLSESYHTIASHEFETVFAENKKFHNLQIQVPLTCKTVMFQLPIRMTFLHDGVILSDPNMTLLDKAICFDVVCDTIVSFQDIKSEGIKTLINLRFNTDYLPSLVETIFSMLCTLPSPIVNPSYCTTLCCDLLKARTSSVPPVFGRIIIAFYKSLDSIDIEVQDRIAELLSLHLSNFSFQWPWKVFNEVIEMPISSRKRLFVQQLVVLCQRLAYHSKMKEILPEELHVFLYEEEMKEKKNNNERLVELFGRKAGFAEVTELLDTLGSVEERANVFFSCMFQVGAVSFSHFVSYLGRYTDICKSFMEENAQMTMSIIMDTVSTHYSHSTQHLSIIFDKLLNFELLTMQIIATWIFSQTEKFCDSTFWCMLNKLVQRRVFQFEKGLIQAKELNMDTTVTKIICQKQEMFSFLFQCFQQQIIANNHRVIVQDRFCQFMRLFAHEICVQFSELEEQQLSTNINDDSVNFIDLFRRMHFAIDEAKLYISSTLVNSQLMSDE